MGILQPPKIYLDTNHLIKISRLRKGQLDDDSLNESYRFIDNRLTQHHFGLIFAPQISLEWVDGNATRETALEIAAVVDSAHLQYEVEADSFVYLHEVLAELRRIEPFLKLPAFEVFYTRVRGGKTARPLGVLANRVPGYFDDGELTNDPNEIPESVPFADAAWYAEQAFHFKNRRPDAYKERTEGHKAAYLQDVANFSNRNKKMADREDVIGWMKRFLRVDRILTALNPQAEVDSLLKQIDVSRCPSVNLFLKSHDQRIRAGITPDDNDVEDWASVHIVPFADLFLTEKRLCHFILQADKSLRGKVISKPDEAAEILRKWL